MFLSYSLFSKLYVNVLFCFFCVMFMILLLLCKFYDNLEGDMDFILSGGFVCFSILCVFYVIEYL